MGMSAAQAKLLSLTARRSDINYQLSSLMRGKLDLMTQASNATDMLSNAQRNNNIFVMTTSDNTQTELSFNSLSKEGLTIVDAKGRTIVPSSYQTNPNKLASILPTSHPSIKSYDGDFIVKEKIKKNYVSMPQNTIPMYSNSEELEQKVVKKFDTVKTDVFTQISDYSTVFALTNSFSLGENSGNDFYNISQFATNMRESGLTGVIANNDGKFLDNDSTYATGTTILSTNASTLDNQILSAFRTEFGINSASKDYKTSVSSTNQDLGASYTAYNERKFQSNVTWEESKDAIQERKGNNIQYVSNAEQLITALLKDATIQKYDSNNDGVVGGDDKNGIVSDANIMLLNDIDLDEMLGGEGSENVLYKIINNNNDIDDNVKTYIRNKYFSGDSDDQFNENFTNFIQIDKFTGAIGGGGFAINNLKMATTDCQFAGMFGTLEGAVLDGIWMDNANVLSTGNDANETTAAILANTVKGGTYISNISATGRQVFDKNDIGEEYNITKHITLCGNERETKAKEANWGLVVFEERTREQIQNGGGLKQDGIKTNAGFMGHANACNYYTTGWTYNSMIDGQYGLRADAVSTGGDYYNAQVNSSDGYKASGNDRPYGHQVHISSVKNNDTQTSHGHAGKDVRKMDTTAGLSNGAVGYTQNTGTTYDGTSLLGVLIKNSVLDNSKIKFFQKEEAEKYDKDSSNEISGWDADINWDDWEYVDENSINDDGTVTLVKKHGEETEEYLEVMSLLEFYKEQGVNVEFDEDKDSGFLTYSFSGYSVDVEYKDDLEKFYSDPYLYKVENGDSSIVIYEREKIQDVDMSQLLFVDDIESVLSQNIKNGIWFLQGASIDDPSKYERKSLDEIGIVETDDENANAIAQAEYEKSMRDIELKEEKLDAQITELESTLKAVEQEIENQEKIIKQNIQSGFSTFAS